MRHSNVCAIKYRFKQKHMFGHLSLIQHNQMVPGKNESKEIQGMGWGCGRYGKCGVRKKKVHERKRQKKKKMVEKERNESS